MRALVIGASGQVGASLLAVLRARGHEGHGTHSTHPAPGLSPLDLTDHAAVARLISQTRPEWIFCPAGLSHVDYCEDHADEAFAINRDGVHAAARAAEAAGAGFVFYSSDYVFDGVGGPFAESDTARPLSVYGRSKREGEQAVIPACRAGQGFRPAVDQRASPSYNPDVAAASVELAERELLGLWHVAGSETLDRYAFALLVCREFALDGAKLTPVKTAELKQRAARPLDGGLDVRKAQAALRTPLRGSAEGLAAMHRELGGA